MRDVLRESRVIGAVLWLFAVACLALAAIRTFGLDGSDHRAIFASVRLRVARAPGSP